MTEASWLRLTFIVSLYGEHEYRRMAGLKVGFYGGTRRGLPRKGARVMYSISPPASGTPIPEPTTWVVPGLGKNLYPIKVFVPERIKRDLQSAANRAQVPLSVFVRSLLLARLFGDFVMPDQMIRWTVEQEKVAEGWAEFSVDERKVPISGVGEEDARPTIFD